MNSIERVDMLSLPFKIFKNQFSHISEHRFSYLRTFIPANIAWSICTLSLNMQWLALFMVSGLFTVLYLLKFSLQSIRLIVLDEKPTYFFRLKFFKQGFLYISYLYVYFIWSLIISISIGYFLLILNPEWITTINQSFTIPHQNEIAHQIAQATSMHNMPVAASNQESIINFFYHMTVFISFIVQGLLAFNLIAVVADEQIPFYRIIWRAGHYQFSNLVFSLLMTFLPLILAYLPINQFDGQSISLVQYLYAHVYYLIFWYILMCIAQNYKAWKNNLEG
jgi:hypothetical protein